MTETLESDIDDHDDTNADIETTYNYPKHVVTVTTISDINLDEKSTCIGPNKVSGRSKGVEGPSLFGWSKNYFQCLSKFFEVKPNCHCKNGSKNCSPGQFSSLVKHLQIKTSDNSPNFW